MFNCFSVGDFTPIRPKEDRHILDMIQHIPVKAGDLVCWDYRIGEGNFASTCCE